MKIILVICPKNYVESPPTGISVLSAYLNHKKIPHEVIDLNIELYKRINNKKLWNSKNEGEWRQPKFEELKKKLEPEISRFTDKILKIIKEDKQDKNNIPVIAFSAHTSNFEFTKEIIRRLKDKINFKAIVGGIICDESGVLTNTEEYIDNYIVGTSPRKFYEVITTPEKFDKIVYGVNEKEEEFMQISDKINEKLYTTKIRTIQTNKGCIMNCSYCGDRPNKGYFMSRKPELVFEEIKKYYEKGIKTIYLADLLCNGNIKNLEKLCDLLIKNKIKLSIKSFCLIRKEMSFEIFQKMAKAGFKELIFGFESGSNEVIKNMNKKFTTKTAEKNIVDAHKSGIKTLITIIVGFPGETKKDFEKTKEFIEKNYQHINEITSITCCYLKKNSDIHKNPEKYGIKKKEESDNWLTWEDETGENNFEERKKRAWKIYNTCVKYKIKSPKPDTYEELKIEEEHKDLILINPPPWGIEDPPTGLAYLSNYMKQKGIKTECYDMNIEFYNFAPKKLKLLWHVENKNFWNREKTYKKIIQLFNQEIDNAVTRIKEQKPRIIALNVVDPKEKITIEFIKRIKKESPEVKVLLGGPGTNSEQGRALFENEISKFIEGYIIGEGEETLYEACKALLNCKTIKDIPGVITYNQKGKQNTFKKRKLLSIFKKDIWPKYEDFDLNDYHSDSLRVEWSRGCISNCVFCKGKALNPGYRFRRPESIVEELKYHLNKNKIKKFIVVDLTINGDLDKLEKTCDLIIESGLDVEWLCQGIPRSDMSQEFFNKMRLAGCKDFQIGVETGSDKIAELMKKRHKIKDATICLERMKKAGINTGIFIMVGFPGETKKDFEKTKEFIKKNRENIDYVKSINAVHLIEGTPLMDEHEQFNIELPETEEYYKWKTKESDWKERKRRMSELYELLKKLKITLTETNFNEGKQENSEEEFIKKINDIQDIMNYSNMKIHERLSKNPIKLFIECYKEHGIKYTIKHTMNYMRLFGNKKKERIEIKLNNSLIDEKQKSNKKARYNKIIKGIKEERIYNGPDLVQIDITNKCNNSCIGCWLYSPHIKNKKVSELKREIKKETILETIKELENMGSKRIILSGGGEPLLHPDFEEIITKICSLEMECNFITNLRSASNKLIDKIIDLQVNELFVSLWASDRNTYKRTHPKQNENDFDKIDEKLDYLIRQKRKRNDKPRVIILNTISKENYKQVFEMAKYASKKEVDRVEFVPIEIIKDATEHLRLGEKEINYIREQIKQIEKKCKDKILKKIDNKGEFTKETGKTEVWGFERFKKRIEGQNKEQGSDQKLVDSIPCYAGWTYARIMANGDVIPCCKAHKHPLGNINKNSFKEIWLSKEYDKFRIKAKNENKRNPYFQMIDCYSGCDNYTENKIWYDRMLKTRK